MKKILLIIVLLGVAVSAFAQGMSRYNIGAYGGVNLSENTPLAGVSISADYLWFRAELDAGWNYTFIQTGRNDFFYLNPSVGLVFGYRYRVFGLVGLTNWPSFDRRKDTFSDSIICPKLKFGGEISLWRDLYVSIAWNYVMAPNRHVSVQENNIITAGLGVSF